jgi:hypothetical protein
MLTFPSEETLVAPWRALAQLSHGAQVSQQGATVAAVFRSWAPLNNAILQGRASWGRGATCTRPTVASTPSGPCPRCDAGGSPQHWSSTSSPTHIVAVTGPPHCSRPR